MGIEYVLYFYGAVCLSMIVFNSVYICLLRGRQPRLERRTERFAAAARGQLERLERGEDLDAHYLASLGRSLRRVGCLIAFDRALRRLLEPDSQLGSEFIGALQPCILELAFVYNRRENTQAAYFTYFLSRWTLHKHMPVQTLQELLLQYMRRDNLYCRVNCLQALCSFGSVRHIVEALRLQEQGSAALHEKIITEALLSFTGCHDELCGALWDGFDSFAVHTQLAVLNYVRFQSGGFGERMLPIMLDETRDKELRLSAIRYMGRYAYPPALDALLRLAAETDPLLWEYTTVSVTAVSSYSDARVFEALKTALHSSNWYVRSAAAAGLEAQNANYEDLMDIVAGNDRYAREMMTYRLEHRRLLRREAEAL